MVERRTLLVLVYVLLIAAAVVAVTAALASMYGVGLLATLGEERRVTTTATTTATVTTTITSIATITSTSVPTETEAKTSTVTTTTTATTATTTTTASLGEQPLALHIANSSSAVLRGRLLRNSVLVLFSIDKPVYRMGEIVHIKATATNLTPEDVKLTLDFPSVKVRNSSTVVTYSGSPSVWGHPEHQMVGGLGAMWKGIVELGPGETVMVDEFTADWNLTGRHVESRTFRGGGSAWVAYDDHPVPPGQYVVYWYVHVNVWNEWGEEFTETIPFEITKQ